MAIVSDTIGAQLGPVAGTRPHGLRGGQRARCPRAQRRGPPEDILYGRTAVITDPFGAELSVLARPPQT
jgi:hypothetical protein